MVFPKTTEPLAEKFSTTVEEYGDTKLDSILEPQVVRTPSVQKISL
ncbi:uncharacterized protein METZ01_LOCUS29360 [marine metagenome]|uniref:Uncharacterized protein n=1 Tax=marine metagenome TaxID=408172 RepID=A0A381QB11_9ZZZZ